jgi:hypothetical protein
MSYFLCWGNSELILLDCHVEICSCLFGLRSYFRKNTVYLIYKNKSWRRVILSKGSLCAKCLSLCAILQNWDRFMWKSQIWNFTKYHSAVCDEFHCCGTTERFNKLISCFLQLLCDTSLSGSLVEEEGAWPLPVFGGCDTINILWINHTWIRWTDDCRNVVEQSVEALC